MAEIAYADCLRLSPAFSVQFTLLKCVLQSKIMKNSLKPPILGVKVIQGQQCLDS